MECKDTYSCNKIDIAGRIEDSFVDKRAGEKDYQF